MCVCVCVCLSAAIFPQSISPLISQGICTCLCIFGGQRSTSVVICLSSLILETVSLSGTWDPLIRVDTSHQALGLCLPVSPERGLLVLGIITISSMGAGVARGPHAYGLTLSPLSHLLNQPHLALCSCVLCPLLPVPLPISAICLPLSSLKRRPGVGAALLRPLLPPSVSLPPFLSPALGLLW